MKCSCVHPYQDAKYGVGMRVHNPYSEGYRCTVCSSQKVKKKDSEESKTKTK